MTVGIVLAEEVVSSTVNEETSTTEEVITVEESNEVVDNPPPEEEKRFLEGAWDIYHTLYTDQSPDKGFWLELWTNRKEKSFLIDQEKVYLLFL